jgi:hypothetical protein
MLHFCFLFVFVHMWHGAQRGIYLGRDGLQYNLWGLKHKDLSVGNHIWIQYQCRRTELYLREQH